METDTGLGIGELPLDLDLLKIASGRPSVTFSFQGREVCKPAVEALALHSRYFKFSHIEPGTVLGRVMPFNFLCNSSYFCGWELFIE